jgi:hypothetical protein
MASLAPLRARELFEWIELNLAPARCEDPLVPVADEYYTALSLLARTTFTPAQRGDALQFLQFYLWRAHLPTEMPAVALALQRFKPTVNESVYFESFFNAIVDAGTSDPRGFSTANFELIGRVADLQFFDRERSVPGWHLMESLRGYLVRHLSGPRCADSVTESLAPSTFNSALTLLHADQDVRAIDSAQITPSRLLPGARITMYWQTFQARRLREGWQSLRGPGKDPIPEALRKKDEWRDRANDLVTDIGQWNGRSEASDRDYFYQKAALYTDLLDLMPPSTARTRALASFLGFMRHEDTDRSRRTLWFVFVRRLLELAHAEYRREVLDAMEHSGHPVVSLYAKLERLVPGGQRAVQRAE